MLAYVLLIDSEDDRAKFESLYSQYRQIMFYEANRILRDEFMAEDAVHMAFLKILNNLSKINLKNCHKTRSFLVIIVRNVSINIYNSIKGREYMELYDSRLADMSVKGPEYENIDSEDYNNLVQNILKLGSKYSDILFLKYNYSYTNHEISAMLGISEEVVRKRLERARTKLMEQLKEGAKEHE